LSNWKNSLRQWIVVQKELACAQTYFGKFLAVAKEMKHPFIA
jgi:hypothetical protein